MNTPATTRKATDSISLSKLVIANFGDYSRKIMYSTINGVGKWLGNRTPISWEYEGDEK